SADLANLGSVATGELNITSQAAGVWDEGITLWVPGDTDTYTEIFDIEAAGDNIAATLTATSAASTTNGVTVTPTIVVKDSLNVVVSPTTITGGVDVYNFSGAGTYTAEVTVAVAFDASGTANQDETTALNTAVSVVLQQV